MNDQMNDKENKGTARNDRTDQINGKNIPPHNVRSQGNEARQTPVNEQKGPQRIELPGGGYGVYMGETGKEQTSPHRRRRTPQSSTSSQGNSEKRTPSGAESNNPHLQSGGQRPLQGEQRGPRPEAQRGNIQNTSVPRGHYGNPADRRTSPPGTNRPRYALSEEERKEIERRHAAARAKRRAAADGRLSRYEKRQTAEPTLKEGIVNYINYYLKLIIDRLYMTWMGITIDIDTVIKSLIIAGMILLFAILQTTVFSRFSPFGATPDLMLGLVIAVGTTEGERWGGATGLAAAFLIEALGTSGITLLPLLYVPVGYTVGVLCTEYLRDSALIRIIYTLGAGILRAIFTAIYANIAFDKIDAGLLFTAILIPEYFSTALMSFIPHVTEWFALKAFHKSREDRISS